VTAANPRGLLSGRVASPHRQTCDICLPSGQALQLLEHSQEKAVQTSKVVEAGRGAEPREETPFSVYHSLPWVYQTYFYC
jgi:hypothetical protein